MTGSRRDSVCLSLNHRGSEQPGAFPLSPGTRRNAGQKQCPQQLGAADWFILRTPSENWSSLWNKFISPV